MINPKALPIDDMQTIATPTWLPNDWWNVVEIVRPGISSISQVAQGFFFAISYHLREGGNHPGCIRGLGPRSRPARHSADCWDLNRSTSFDVGRAAALPV